MTSQACSIGAEGCCDSGGWAQQLALWWTAWGAHATCVAWELHFPGSLAKWVWSMGGTGGRRLKGRKNQSISPPFCFQWSFQYWLLFFFFFFLFKFLVYAIPAPGGQPHSLCSQFLWSGPCHRPESHPVASVFGSGNATSCVPSALEGAVVPLLLLPQLPHHPSPGFLVSSSNTCGTNSLLLNCFCLQCFRWCLCCQLGSHCYSPPVSAIPLSCRTYFSQASFVVA